MSTRNADVNLIVRARTEGERAVQSLNGALEQLFDDARSGGSDIAKLGKILASLDRAYDAVGGSVDKADKALRNQQSSIVENKAALAALVAQASEARTMLAGFGDQASKDFVGPRTAS